MKVCDVCGKQFKNEWGLAVHKNKAHGIAIKGLKYGKRQPNKAQRALRNALHPETGPGPGPAPASANGHAQVDYDTLLVQNLDLQRQVKMLRDIVAVILPEALR